MPQRAFFIPYLGTGPAPELVGLHDYVRNRRITIIRCHTKRRDRIAPQGDNRSFERRCDMHQACIITDDQFRRSHEVGAFIEFEFTAGIVDLHPDRSPRSRLHVSASSGPPSKIMGCLHPFTKLFPFMNRPSFSSMRCPDHAGDIARSNVKPGYLPFFLWLGR